MASLTNLGQWFNATLPFSAQSVHNSLTSLLSTTTTTHLASLTPSDIKAFPTFITDIAKHAMQIHQHPKRSGLGPHPHGTDALRNRVHIAHGVIASLTVVILFPSVAIILRVIRSKYIVRIHYSLQLFNLFLLTIAFSLGVWLSWLDGWLWHWPHQIIGTIIFILFLLQPILGLYQHTIYLRTGLRGIWAASHVWYGRFLIVMGIINGGLGLQLAANTSWGPKVAYIVVALFMLALYVAVQYVHHRRLRKGVKARSVGGQEGNKQENWSIV